MVYPDKIDNLVDVTGTQTLAAAGHSARHNDANDALREVRDYLDGVGFGSRNLIYNGAMQVHQRGTSVTGITTTGYYTADRWRTTNSGQGTWTQSVENDAPTGSGFRKSLKMLCTTADAAPDAGDQLRVDQLLEGYDVQRVAKGTAAAQQLTVSFWVKSNVTGTYIAELFDTDNSRQVSASYSISTSGTWEKKTITYPADTTGAFDNDNNTSLILFFWLGAGSNATSGTLNTTWASQTQANRAVGQTNLAAATNNYWQITGVQLEVGPNATEFEFKSFGQELRECQRYYWRTSGQDQFSILANGTATATTGIVAAFPNPVTMRSRATSADALSLSATDGVGGYLISAHGVGVGTREISTATFTVSGATQYRPHLVRTEDNTGYIGFSAEL